MMTEVVCCQTITNSGVAGQGSIPFVPYLRAPYFVWIGHVPQLATVLEENRVEAPPMFPPTFLYTQSWEDPRPDMEARGCLHSLHRSVCRTWHLLPS